MKKLTFSISINAPKKKVWDTMLHPVTYREWANAAWPGSYYEGEWKQGENIKFISPGNGGTLVNVTEQRLFEYSFGKHIAILYPDLTEDRTSDMAKGWIGSTEAYTFTENNGSTTLDIEIHTYPAWESMLESGWPVALEKLKEICEK